MPLPACAGGRLVLGTEPRDTGRSKSTRYEYETVADTFESFNTTAREDRSHPRPWQGHHFHH
jgi:hypothetical protein